MPTLIPRYLSWTLVLLVAGAAQAQDLHFKKNISVGGNVVSSTETSIKGARERTVSQTPAGSTVTIRQCDLKRTITINDQAQAYFIASDPQDDAALKAAALVTGMPDTDSGGGFVTESSAITDTGERKTIDGYSARHLKAKVSVQPSQNACSQQSQEYEVDGWYADIAKEISSCQQSLPPVRLSAGCTDRVIHKHTGSAKLGYPLSQTITLQNGDGNSMQVVVQAAEITKGDLRKELFDVPAGYREAKSLAELSSVPATQTPQPAPTYASTPPPVQQHAGRGGKAVSAAALMSNPAAAMALAQNPNAMGMQMMAAPGSLGPAGAFTGPGTQPAGSAAVAVPQVLGPKAPGKIRVGVAPPDAQLGQGNAAGADYSTPIRNVEVALMSGPAVEIAALESHVPMQLQAEAQQKQCDYIMYSGVIVKHSSGGGFGKFMKIGQTAASLNPAVMMTKSMGSMVAAQGAAAASQIAAQQMQQQAISQLAGFNGQIKSKDDVTVQYQLVATGQNAPVLQNTLQGKAKSDGEDVLTPLLQQQANAVLTQVTKK
jgi:hypothetical protein